MKFGGRVILMTAVALVLAALALGLCWYVVSTETSSHYYYLDYVDSHYSYPYSHLAGLSSYDSPTYAGTGEVMDLERILIYGWLLVGTLFLAAVLADSKLGSIVLGWAVVVISLLAVLQFLGRVDLGSSEPVTRSWGLGLIVAFVAMILQAVAVMAWTYVTYPDLPRVPHGR